MLDIMILLKFVMRNYSSMEILTVRVLPIKNSLNIIKDKIT